ncbi:MAG: hypothetical protein JWO58_197, partial [Chitinophagaceae bacterium]|nr:hypothetical protein [Chitinophagaceae bacterium]
TLNGEDIVYEITFSPGTTSILVSLTNVNQYSYLFTSSDCAINPATIYPIAYVYSGDTPNLKITAPAVGNKLYLYLDHSGSSNLTFDISFGAVTQGTYISIPDTRGKFEFASANCISNPFLRQVDIQCDRIALHPPASFGTSNASHEFGFTVFLQNLTGIEGVKSFQFNFKTGFSLVNLTTTSMPGRYASGTWNGTVSGNIVTWVFTNATDPSKGDYDDVTKTCLSYPFYMNATPLVGSQYIDINARGDGKTPGYSGYQYSGCCATPASCTLYGASGYGTGTGTGIGTGTGTGTGIGIGVGNAGLPVDMLDAWMSNTNTLHWKTTNEKKLAYYVVQYAADGKQFEDIQKIAAVGNEQNGLNNYQTNLGDFQLKPGYLRIGFVDEDGTEKFSKIISYHLSQTAAFDVLLSPNPVQSLLHIQSTEDMQSVILYDLNGTPIYSRSMDADEHVKEVDYDFINQPKGIYTLQIITSQGIVHKRVVKE